MHHNRCAIEGHQWFMSAALTLIPFMTVSAYRILIEGPRHFYTRTPLWTYFRLTSQEDEACVDPSDTFGNSRTAGLLPRWLWSPRGKWHDLATIKEIEVARKCLTEASLFSLFTPGLFSNQTTHIDKWAFFFFSARTGSLFSSHHVNTYPAATLLYLDPFFADACG